MPPTFTYPPKPSRGDTAAVISPSGRSASRLAEPFERGLTRLREEFGLVPLEYATTRAAEASAAERARDIHDAFAGPAVKAVIASIGGEDELKVLAHLDPGVLAGNPKTFFGYTGAQRDPVVSALAEYHPGVPLVFGVDFGHTDPQHVIPSGGDVTVDGQSRQIYVTY